MPVHLSKPAGRARRILPLLSLSLSLSAAAAPEIGPPARLPRPALAGTAAFRTRIRAQYENPYDPDQIRVNALVSGPNQRHWIIPAFWFVPCRGEPLSRKSRYGAIRLLRFFIPAAEFRRDRKIVFFIDTLRLVQSRTGRTRVLDDFEKPPAWRPQAGVRLRRVPVGSAGAGHALRVEITPHGRGWPGANLTPPVSDWSGFDTLEFRFRPGKGLSRGPVIVEFYNQAGNKSQHLAYQATPGTADTDWRTVSWKFHDRIPRFHWTVSGQFGEWRARIAVPVTGTYRVRFQARDRSGTAQGPARSFRLECTDSKGFLHRPPGTARADYLQFDSGAPYFAIGSNLLGHGVGPYEYYLPKFAAAGCNFLRFWMSGSTLGIERDKPVRYDPVRAAIVDRVVNLARAHGIYLMVCLTDFREAKKEPQGYWSKTAYCRICRTPSGFFTNPEARAVYRKRLRYIVARWAASPHVHSWELFNEVDLTSAWRRNPEAVRAWHRAMAAFLRQIDPYRHLITSSFSGIEDDPLWGQAGMELVQRHFYTSIFLSFADALSQTVRKLQAHGKPVLVGEFGRSRNLYARMDVAGVSLHNGLWGAAMAGAGGGAMPWWWQWIDGNDLYPHFAALARFTRGVPWVREKLHPAPAGAVQVRFAAANPAAPPATIVLCPAHTDSFRPAPWNRPLRITVDRRGRMTPPNLLPGLLHGRRNHPDLHNPITFSLDYPGPGTFSVRIGTVSGYGGAALRLCVDGVPRLEKSFPDTDPGHQGLDEFAGQYTVPVPAGRHTVTLENTGRDWFRIVAISLGRYGRRAPGVRVLGLYGAATALVWIENRDYAWFAPLLELPLQPTPPLELRLTRLPPGAWRAARFDPQSGTWKRPDIPLRSGPKRELRIPLGPLRKDIAIRLTRIGR